MSTPMSQCAMICHAIDLTFKKKQEIFHVLLNAKIIDNFYLCVKKKMCWNWLSKKKVSVQHRIGCKWMLHWETETWLTPTEMEKHWEKKNVSSIDVNIEKVKRLASLMVANFFFIAARFTCENHKQNKNCRWNAFSEKFILCDENINLRDQSEHHYFVKQVALITIFCTKIKKYKYKQPEKGQSIGIWQRIIKLSVRCSNPISGM